MPLEVRVEVSALLARCRLASVGAQVAAYMGQDAARSQQVAKLAERIIRLVYQHVDHLP